MFCKLCTDRPLQRVSRHQPLYRCRQCGLIDHQRSDSADSEKERYREVVFDTPQDVANQQLEWMRRAIQSHESQRLLDVGCGTGSFLVQAARGGWQVSGLEISPAAASRAQSRLKEACILCCEAEQLPVDEEYDVITLWDVLDHLENPWLHLSSLKQRLKPQGKLIVRVRNGPFHLLLRAFERCLPWRTGKSSLGVIHRYGFSVYSLSKTLRKAGFETRVQPTAITGGKKDRTTGAGGAVSQIKWVFQYACELVRVASGNRLCIAPSILICATYSAVPEP